MRDVSIDQLNLSNRACNCLKRARVFFVSQLVQLTEDELKGMRNMGAQTVQEVMEVKEKLKDNPDFFNDINEEEKAPEITAADIKSMLVIHEAFPQLLGKHIRTIYYRNKEGMAAQDWTLEELGFSNRTLNAFIHIGLKGINDVAMLENATFHKIKNLGAKSVSEVLSYLRDNADVTYDVMDENMEALFSAVISSIKEKYPGDDFSYINGPLMDALYDCRDKLNAAGCSADNILDSEVFKNNVVKSYPLKKYFSDYFLGLFTASPKSMTPQELIAMVPSIFVYDGMVPDVMSLLEKDNRIEFHKGVYRPVLPTVYDWLSQLDDRNRDIITSRFSGKTLDECGQAMGVTRERIRQIIVRILRSKPVLREDDYSYWFKEYDIDPEAMKWIFDVGDSEYKYLDAVYKKGDKPLEEIVFDQSFSWEMYSNYRKYLNRNCIYIKDEYVPVERSLLCRKLAQVYCSEEEMSFDDFYVKYQEFLKDNNLADNERLLFPNERAFETRLQDSMYVLYKRGRRFRYYPIYEYDVEDLVESLHFEQYKDVEISTYKIFKDNPAIMEEFNLIDEYELHNLLNKTEETWNAGNKYDVKVTRMPFLVFGNADRKEQVEAFLYKVAPINTEDFGRLYESEFGMRSATAIGNLLPLISKYYHNGLFDVGQPQLNADEEKFLSSVLNDEFYFIDDVKEKFISEFGPDNIGHLNPMTFKELGYKVYISYIIKDTYSSASEYFLTKFMQDDYLDMNLYGSRILYVQSAWGTLTGLRSEYELLEYEDKKFMKMSHFTEKYGGITKQELMQYADDVIAFAKDEDIFTIKSIKNKGFHNRIDDLGLSDWFSACLVRNSNKVGYVKTASGIIFANTDRKITILDLLISILSKKKEMNIYSLMEHLDDVYGINLRKDKITWSIKDSVIYYEPVSEVLSYEPIDY